MLKWFFLIVLLNDNVNAERSRSLFFPAKVETKHFIRVPRPQLNFDEEQDSPCHQCFNAQTVDGGRRMLVTPCGEPECVSLVNSTAMIRNEPTQKYDFSECGVIPKTLQLKVSTNINNTLRPGEYPWLVRIESRSNLFSRMATLCGATLIHPQWVLTAAHCMFDSKTDRLYPTTGIHLYMGHYHRSSSSRDEFVARPSLYLIHPKFRISRQAPAPIHDLALIKLEKPVPLSPTIVVACLPKRTDKVQEGALAFTAGWGHVAPDASAVDEPRKARLKITSKACQQLKIDRQLHLCGRSEQGRNICSGDSGTGLMVRARTRTCSQLTNWRWYVFGVASFGLDLCSTAVNHDNAFASVQTDIDWIHDVLEKY